MRLFIAVNFSDEVKKTLYKNIEELKKYSMQGSFSHLENLHLTLVFIGETNDVEKIKMAMEKTVTEINARAFLLPLMGIGTFKCKEGDIYYIDIDKSIELMELNKSLRKEIKKIFPIEEEEFKAHLTLGRRIKVKEDFSFNRLNNSLICPEIIVNRISLMKSERINGKLTYTELYYNKLSNDNKKESLN